MKVADKAPYRGSGCPAAQRERHRIAGVASWQTEPTAVGQDFQRHFDLQLLVADAAKVRTEPTAVGQDIQRRSESDIALLAWRLDRQSPLPLRPCVWRLI